MKVIFTITRNEIRNLFYSPVAWFLTIVFMALSAFFYTSAMYPFAKWANMEMRNDPFFAVKGTESMTAWIFSDLNMGFFAQLLPNLYLFIPLLTMNIISREFNNGTIKLLYSSPLKTSQIVLGKYLAVMIYNLALVAITGIFLLAGLTDIKSMDTGPVLSAMAGIYLLLCAYGAIGFFMSAITNYQIISAVASFTTFFVLMNIGSLWQQYDLIRDLTWFLSLQNRVQKLIAGLVSSKDIIYYLLIIFMFVGFTFLRLKAARETKPWYVHFSRYLTITVLCLLVGYISSQPRFIIYRDVTNRQSNTIHPKTRALLDRLNNGPLEVTLYVNLLDGNNIFPGLPAARNRYLSGFWEQYQRFKTDIDFKYVYYYDYEPARDDSALYKKFPGKNLQQIAGIISKGYRLDSAMFIGPEEIRKIIDLRPENFQLVMQLKYKERSAFLRVFPIAFFWPEEINVNAVLKKLAGEKMPQVLFASGQLERNIYKRGEREFQRYTIAKGFPRSLVNLGFDADTINLQTEEIPSDLSMLVIADPKTELNAHVSAKIRNYINGGGNMIIYGEPGKQYVLNPLLQQTGVQLMNGQLVQKDPNETPDKISFYYNSTFYNMSDDPWYQYIKYLEGHNAIKDTAMFRVPGVTGIGYREDSGFLIKPILMTAPGKAWLKAGKLINDSTMPAFNASEGDRQEHSFAFGVQLTRKWGTKEQRIVVLGDADMSSNSSGMDDIALAPYTWLNYKENPVFTPLPYAKDNRVVLSPRKAIWEKLIYVWLLPGLLMITGAIVLIRRKRK
ncbi:Gldg family protein [Pseudobacter ginsenosidimutans]|uniref:ABC-2 type transport system permease protein n=1 Tax=Pseudobacter ginsenosidimutans TaxID=661488 RepID=A0A4Q7N0N8_9BACT|nr:Gldg family protein [Pseudobacter ginsenosidimutans]QEC43356.1 ABC transporter permease subunit [Pseudobacter ginsenosidimutans]RZS74722.1 ABC-2 type transport system permease protein [Pseudobacter ginsenosidimutans]